MALLKRSLDYKRIKKAWYLPIILLMPGVTVLTYALMRLLGLPLSAPPFAVVVGLSMFVAFFVAALGEELGWSGYAIDPMQARRVRIPSPATIIDAVRTLVQLF